MPKQGSVEEIIKAEIGGSFTLRPRAVTVTTTPVEILRNNPERVMWLIVNTGDAEVTFGWGLPLVAGSAIPFGGNGGGASVNVREDFILPIFPAFAVVSAGTGTLYITEVFRVSGPRDGGI